MTQPSIWQQLPLSQNRIRLLTVYPSTDTNESISCFLSVVNLDHNPAYLALSYTWGDPTITVPITLEGEPWQVTLNLDDALRCLRDVTQPLTIFVDALCINQQDTDEKNVQVPMMGRVYSQASTVHCCIGRADTESTRTVEILTRARRGAVDLDVSFQDEPINLADMRSLVYFLDMPYWKRAWIIQEVVVSSHVVFHYGKYQFSKQDLPNIDDFVRLMWGMVQSFNETFLCVEVHPDDEIPIISAIYDAASWSILPILSEMSTLTESGLRGLSDGHLVRLTKQAASVKHDHIYAFLSLLTPELRQRIRPDYRLEASQVFRDFAYKSMQVNGGMRLLSFAVGLTKNPLDLPSWVPDFSNEDATGMADSDFVANQQIPKDLVLCKDSILGVAAFHLDHITAVRSVVRPEEDLSNLGHDSEEAAAAHVEWRKFFGLEVEADQLRPYVGGGSLEEAYWKTMSRGRISTAGMEYKSRWIVPDDLRLMSAWLRQVVQRPDSEDATTMADAARRHSIQMANLWHYQTVGNDDTRTAPSCQMFKTANGYIGTTYRHTASQIDDDVYLIAGSASPVIVRSAQPASHGTATFRLVTHTHIPGLMLSAIMPNDVTAEQLMTDYDNYIHPHMKVATSWNRILLR